MSGINSIAGPGSQQLHLEQAGSALPAAPAVSNPSMGSSTPPDLQSMPFQRMSLSTLGLSNPVNSEDFAALLSDIEMKLDKAMKDSRNARVISLAQGIRSALAGLISRSNAMAAMGQEMFDCQTRIDDNSTRLTSFQQDQLQANVESSTLRPRIDAARAKYDQLNGLVQGMDPKSPPYLQAVQARDAAQAVLSDLQERQSNADARAGRSGQSLVMAEAQVAADRGALVALASQYSGLQLSFMAAFGELTHMFAGRSEGAHSDNLVDHASELCVDDLNDLVKAFEKRQAALDQKNVEVRQERLRDEEQDRAEGAVALVVSAIAEVLTALADIAPASLEGDETSAEVSNSMTFRG